MSHRRKETRREREREAGGEQAAAAAESRRLARRKSRSRRASRDRVNARAQGPLFRAAEPTPPAPALPARAAASRASLSPFGFPRSPRTGWVVELVSTRYYHLGAPSEHASRKTSLRRSFVHTFAGGGTVAGGGHASPPQQRSYATLPPAARPNLGLSCFPHARAVAEKPWCATAVRRRATTRFLFTPKRRLS